MEERKAAGMLWMDTKESMQQQVRARGLCRQFNSTGPEEAERRIELLHQILGSCGRDVWIEPPLTLAAGRTVTIGDGTYINSNLTMVDDYKITIGSHVLIGPNVTISATSHPLHWQLRPQGQMYSREVVIEDDVWISSCVVICAGVRIGRGSVIGAGSVVTRDIPPMTLAFGVPCRAVRAITEEDLHQFEPLTTE